ncbi:LOW QUALITY PROTEIN: hypothetical protein OSB04_001616 [Centaurea solstitialis]|uniref:CCHC-type domain-containing protein n=1 Tax=Centaurea solstitialis TaxID=347529 RepID=A0AA38TRC9_9ASTR|nr:LOW QUALITY PROTEIN: hypothetical protein OSB04_001616 [Centaurea solstitialis]
MTERVGVKRKWDESLSDPRRGKAPKFEHRGGQNLGAKPCGKCHHVHRGNCQMGTMTCFQCGQPGHMSRDCTRDHYGSPDHIRPDCPQLKKSGAPQLRGRKNGRQSRLGLRDEPTIEEAENAPDVVTGTFTINSLRAKVLFDTGADYSYATPKLIKLLRVKLRLVSHPFEVDTANRGRVLGLYDRTRWVFYIVGLHPMPIEDLDVVLGMDWLIRNETKIDCKKNIVKVQLLDGRRTVIYGDKRNRKTSLISIIKANRCIRKGCLWFMAYVLDSRKEKLGVSDIDVVCEY